MLDWPDRRVDQGLVKQKVPRMNPHEGTDRRLASLRGHHPVNRLNGVVELERWSLTPESSGDFEWQAVGDVHNRSSQVGQ
jgi:hypothetical protein